MQPILSLSDHADHGHYHGAYHRSRADSAYLAYHAIGLLPVFTQQPCRSEIEQDTENEQYADRLQSVGICRSRTCVCIRGADLLIACLCR